MVAKPPASRAADKRWNDAIDWLLSSSWTADPDCQDRFWGAVDGPIAIADLRSGNGYAALQRYRAHQARETGDPAEAERILADLRERGY
jgi:hypothetical protein